MSIFGKDMIIDSLKIALKSSNAADAAENAVNFLFPSVGSSEYRAVRTFAPKPSIRPLTNKNYVYNYFRLSPSEDSWGATEIDELFRIDAMEAMNKSIERMKNVAPKSEIILRSSFLELLSDRFNEQDKLTGEWLVALAETSPYFFQFSDREPRLLWEVDNRMRMKFILTNGLRRLSVVERAITFEAAIEQAKELSLLCDFFRSAAGDVIEGGSVREREEIGFGSRTSEIRKLLSDKVRDLLEKQYIWNQANPSAVFRFAWGSGLNEEVMQCTRASLGQQELRKAVFILPISTVSSTGGNYEHVAQHWDKIVDLALAETIAQSEIKESGDTATKAAAEKFLAALERARTDPF